MEASHTQEARRHQHKADHRKFCNAALFRAEGCNYEDDYNQRNGG
jgi:hypothetical protein